MARAFEGREQALIYEHGQALGRARDESSRQVEALSEKVKAFETELCM